MVAIAGLVGQVRGVTPLPVRAWERRTESPVVWQTWAWCRSRSTVAVARVLGMSSSKAAGCRLELTRDGAFLVGGVDEAVEALGGVLGDGQQPDVVDHDQVGSQDPGDGFADGVVGAVAAEQDAEVLQGEPGDVQAGLDGLLAEGFEQERLPGPGRARRPRGSPAGAPIPGSAAPAGSGPGWSVAWRPRRRTSSRSGTRRQRAGWPAAERSRPAASSVSRARRTSAGSHRCALAVAITSGA